MADWSELPKDILHLISQRLHSPLYLLRFRSVCSSWRSSTSPINPSITLTNTFSLSHRTLLLLTPPNNNHHHRPWLVKLSLDPRARTARLFHPLSRFHIERPRFGLDLLSLPALDLGREFLLTNTRPFPDSLYMEKLVFSSHGKERFALLTIHVSGKLALFRSGDAAWTVIPEMPTPYDDVCVFKGALYGADSNGRTVTVAPDDAQLTLAADPVFGGDKKFLVESQGALLLVDMYLSNYYFCTQGLFHEEFDEEDEDDGDVDEIGWERTVKFCVFRLDEEAGRWVEVNSLGESVLFLGDDCAFSASANDLGLGRGNCVVFRDDGLGFNRVENGMGVFCLDDGKISPLWECPGFAELFCPPPDWVGLQL